ncbi:hypothetical protein BS47DRAFT_1353229 [Hydnum rufescens UP504]|uniref:Uncharacterized protein n=1 Tax=Hydnum rufescens UP504 TaxID=1448309 RepID=A0A9P6AI52_9AGAM|nr:hypothetical protein BS47DRAFT_1353229 [Hydnum rufescens UP504]
MADQLKPPRLFDENLQGIHKPTSLQSCRLGHRERLPESKLSAYTRADPKHDVRAHLLLYAISLQVWTHLHALGVEVVSQPSPQVLPYHSHQGQ